MAHLRGEVRGVQGLKSWKHDLAQLKRSFEENFAKNSPKNRQKFAKVKIQKSKIVN